MKFNRSIFYFTAFKYALRTVLSRKERPFIGGIALNDKCNLHCRHCFVSNRQIPDLSFEEIRRGLSEIYGMGMRCLYIEGGEPFLWKEDSKDLEDVIGLARQIGFLYIIVYTNGTFPINTSADLVFVSLDGLKEDHEAMRGKCYDRIMHNVNQSRHGKIFANYTITAQNRGNIAAFCEQINGIPNFKGVCFYLYTPYQGKDELDMNPDERKRILEYILSLKGKGHPVMNSRATLKAAAKGDWKRPNRLSYLFAENRLYPCCRAIGREDICAKCGYLGFAEIYNLSHLKIGSLLNAVKYL